MKKLLLRIVFKKSELVLLKFIFERNYGLLGMQNYIYELHKIRKLFNCQQEILKEVDDIDKESIEKIISRNYTKNTNEGTHTK